MEGLEMGKKRISVANFNVVFIDGKDEKPLLEYFDTILMSALRSGFVRECGDSSYLLLNVDVFIDMQGEYVLTGNIVKKTVLEVLSDINESGELIELDNHYPSAPYSTFVIYLKNHRMIFSENQKGSPSIRTFRTTVKYIVDKYVRIQNAKLKSEGKPELPIPVINVVGIPTRENLEETLKKVERINELKLKFYPLNGDGDIENLGLFTRMIGKVRNKAGSKKGEMVFRSPENINGVIEIVSKTEGVVEPIFKVTYSDGTKTTIRNDTISEKRQIEFESVNFTDEMDKLIEKGKEIDSIKYVSDENAKIYKSNKAKIIKFVKKH